MSFICFDTEDNSRELMAAGKSGFDKEVTQIAAISRSRKKFYNTGDVDEFKAWLKKQPERLVYSLNIQYDLGNLFGDSLDELDQILVGGRVIKAKWEGTGITFLDVFNIWPMSVAKLGESFGLEKLEFDSHGKEYVFRDVEIIFKAMDYAWDFATEHDIVTMPTTLGGLCVKIWKFLGGVNCHDTNPLAKEAYFGGRVELFKHRNETEIVAYTDINSLYPAMMLKDFPAEVRVWTSDILPKFGVVKCRVKIPKCGVAVLPYRSEDGRILYPYGEFSGTWTVVEIQAAIARGATIDVEECFGTDDSFSPYKAFVLDGYAKRQNSKTESERLFHKLILNNLYGRLGTGGVVGRTVWQTYDNQDDGVCYGSKVLVKYQMPLSKETNWLHAAYVTAYGRLQLLEFIERIGVERMIYCDTDSTIFDCPDGLLPFKPSSDLGEMKIEQHCTSCGSFYINSRKAKCCVNPIPTDFWPGCETYAPKCYRVGKKFKAKGVPQRLAQQFLEHGRVDFDLPFKMREAIRFYDRNNARRLSVWRNVEKFKRSDYDKKKRAKNRYIPLQIFV